jgi:hypothetical protein
LHITTSTSDTVHKGPAELGAQKSTPPLAVASLKARNVYMVFFDWAHNITQ